MKRANRILVSFLVGILILGFGIYATITNLLPWKTRYGFPISTRLIAIGIAVLLAVLSACIFPEKLRQLIR